MNSKVRFGILLATIILLTSVNFKSEGLSQEQILKLVNQDRAEHGLPALSLNPVLNLAALAKAEDMSVKHYFAHVSPAGTTPWQWFKSVGYNYAYAGENLASGYSDEQELVNSWMASPEHRANILSPFYHDLGLAIIDNHNQNLVVQLFGSKEAKLTFHQ